MMPRHPEGRVALTQAERQARRRSARALREKRMFAALMRIAHDDLPAGKARAIARDALEGKPQ